MVEKTVMVAVPSHYEHIFTPWFTAEGEYVGCRPTETRLVYAEVQRTIMVPETGTAQTPDIIRHQRRRRLMGSHNGYADDGRRYDRRDIGRLSAAQRQAELADALGVLEAELADTIEAEFEAQRLAELAAAAQPPVQLRRALARPRGRVIVERENGEVERYG
jgi:hypothetical protein